ncbi:MAG: SMP-30/gluconolactonase/LRE family protein [Adhaeribacter sp.]
MTNTEIQVLSPHTCLLAEGPAWDAAGERLYWVDILAGEVLRFSIADQQLTSFQVGQLVGAIALTAGGKLIAALQHGFALIDWERRDIQMLSDPEAHLPDNRFNDGKCDPAGRFWAGTMELNGQKGAGNLYLLHPDLSVSHKLSGLSVSNGLAWSPDQSTFYFIDTPTGQVAAFDYDRQSGAIENKRVVVSIPPEMGKPDGMTIDAEGMLWIALWDGWGVGRWDPQSGALLNRISLPVARVTSCTFGGKELQQLYITTAKTGLPAEGLEQQPLAGCVFVVKNLGVKGLPAVLFHDLHPPR